MDDGQAKDPVLNTQVKVSALESQRSYESDSIGPEGKAADRLNQQPPSSKLPETSKKTANRMAPACVSTPSVGYIADWIVPTRRHCFTFGS